MAAPSHRVDLAIVGDSGQIWQWLVQRRVVRADGSPGEAASQFCDGFATARLDRPIGRTVYGNRVGGFRAECPATGAPMARDFAKAVEAWRAGGDDGLLCAACGQRHALEAMARPPIALGTEAVVLVDVGRAVIGETDGLDGKIIAMRV